MKRILHVIWLVSACMGNYAAASSTINISGAVRDNTCEVAVVSKNFSVNLGEHAVKQFPHVGATSPPVQFQILFSRCEASAQKVKVGFVGATDSSNAKLLAIASGGLMAGGLGVQILDVNGAEVGVNTPFSVLTWSPLVANQPNALTFYANTMATVYPVTAGQVVATATFTLEYF